MMSNKQWECLSFRPAVNGFAARCTWAADFWVSSYLLDVNRLWLKMVSGKIKISCVTWHSRKSMGFGVRQKEFNSRIHHGKLWTQVSYVTPQSSVTLVTWCKEPTYWERPWCWERLKANGDGGGRGWDGKIASLTQWTWIWAISRR